MTDYLEICKTECNKEMTKADVVKSMVWGFCDVPYIMLGVNVE